MESVSLAKRIGFLFLAPSVALSGCIGTDHSLNAYGGARSLGNNDFDEIDEHTVYGVDAVLGVLELHWLAYEGGWLHSSDDASSVGPFNDVDLELDEFFLGLRFVPWHVLVEPYVSAGISYVDGSLDAESMGNPANDGDESLAGYARLGAAMRFGLFRFGLDARALAGSDLVLNTETDVDYFQVAGFVGVLF